MADIPNPHDRFVKELFGDIEIAMDLLRNYLPTRVLDLVDLPTLSRTHETFVDERLGEVLSDLVFKARLRGAGKLFVYIVIEHKSFNDRYTLLQVLKAMVMLWDEQRKEKRTGKRNENKKQKKEMDGSCNGVDERADEEAGDGENDDRGGPLPVVIPFILYHGRQKLSFPRRLQLLFTPRGELLRYVPEFVYELLDVRELSDDEVRGKAETRAALLLMRHIFGKDLAKKLSDILKLSEEVAEPQRRSWLVNALLWYTVAAARNVGEEAVGRAIYEGLGSTGESVMPTLAEKWHNEGKQEGRREGIVQSAQEMVIEAVRAHFGRVPGEIQAAVKGVGSPELLKKLLNRAVAAKDLTEFEAALKEVSEAPPR